MALIHCKECGKEISDTVKKCPHCGYKLYNNPNKKNLKIVIIGLFIILITAIICLICFSLFTNKLSDEEQKGIEAINVLKSSLKNQDSLNVYEIWYRNEKSEQILIDYSAQNGFGGSNRNVALIENGKFMSTDSKADNTITKYTKTEDMIEILASKSIKTLWDSKCSETAPFTQLNKDKILKNMER